MLGSGSRAEEIALIVEQSARANDLPLRAQATCLFVGKMMQFGVNAALPIILTRVLPVSVYGIYQQILLLAAVFVPLLQCEIPGSLLYFYPRRKEALGDLLSQSMSLLLILSAVGSVGLWGAGLRLHIISLVGIELLLVVAYIGLATPAGLLDDLFVAEKRSGLVVLYYLLDGLLRVMCVLIGVATERGTTGIVASLVVYALARLMVLSVYLYTWYGLRLGFANRRLLHEQIVYVVPLALSTLAGILSRNVDKIIVSALLNDEDYALYAVGGLGVMYAITFVYTAVGEVSVPRLAELAAANKIDEARVLWHRMVAANALITLPSVTFALVLAEPIIVTLFTSRYVNSLAVWRLNLALLCIQMTGYGYVPRAFARTRGVLVSNVARFLVGVPLAYVMVRQYGLIGGALSYIAAFLVGAAIQLAIGRQVLQARVCEFMPWKYVASVGLVSVLPVPLLVAVRQFGLPPLTSLITGVLVYFPLVAFIAKLMGLLRGWRLMALISQAIGFRCW